MPGVWHFDPDGVIRQGNSVRRRELVHLPTGQVVNSHSLLEQILTELGWERYQGVNPDLIQFHKQSSNDLISVPRDFSRFSSVHMFDIVLKNSSVFHVRET